MKDYLKLDVAPRERSLSKEGKYSKMKRYTEKLSRASKTAKNSKSNYITNQNGNHSFFNSESSKPRTPLTSVSQNNKGGSGKFSHKRNYSNKPKKKKKKKKSNGGNIRIPAGRKTVKWSSNLPKGNSGYNSILKNRKNKISNKTIKTSSDYNNLRMLKKRGSKQGSKKNPSVQNKKVFSPLSHRTVPKFSISKKPVNTSTNFDNYFKLSLKSKVVTRKLKDSDFLLNSGNQVNIINKAMKDGIETYEKIRVYADLAQEYEFDILEEIFFDDDARRLCSRVLKLERWTIILVFYFEIVKKKIPKLLSLLKGMMENIWNNQGFLISWLKILVVKHSLDWDLENSLKDLYPEYKQERDTLIVKIVNSCQLTTGYLIKM